MLSRYVISFLPRSKHVLISWLKSLSAVILEPKKIKFVTVSPFLPSFCHEAMGLDAIISAFECWVLSQLFHFPLASSSRSLLVSFHFLPSEWYHLHSWGCWYFSWQSGYYIYVAALGIKGVSQFSFWINGKCLLFFLFFFPNQETTCCDEGNLWLVEFSDIKKWTLYSNLRIVGLDHL